MLQGRVKSITLEIDDFGPQMVPKRPKMKFSKEIGREAAIEDATQQAIEEAIAAGAKADTVEMIDFEEVPLSYVPGGAVRVRIKTAGELETC